MSALEIMQACLEYFKNNSETQEKSEKAEMYLNKIARVINGENVILTGCNFFEMHSFVISIYARILDDGKVTKGKWTDNHWKKVLVNIEECYKNKEPETFEVRRMKK